MSEIHVARDGVKFGPYDEPTAQSLLAEGRIAPTDLVWRKGMPDWRPAAEVLAPMLAAAGFAAPPPLAPPMPAVTGALPSAQPSTHGSAKESRGPIPPRLHWALVLLFSILTLGIFALVWSIVQAHWAKRIDPGSRAPLYMWLSVILSIVYAIAAGIPEAGSQGTPAAGDSGLGILTQIVATVLMYCGFYSIRRSMLDHYNEVEPIGLRISGAMTFMFTLFFLQHRMTRIARWKLTGDLPPQ